MMSRKSKVFFCVFVAVFAMAWTLVFLAFKDSALTVFPSAGYGVYALTDNEAGGFSTSDLTISDSLIAARVNVRSGKAYPYAGIGINLMSLNNRPVGFFDFSRYDSIAVTVSTGRMRSVTLRILTDDPVYSRRGVYLSYRPLEREVPVASALAEAKVALTDFQNKEWWLVAQGLDKDDGLAYFHRSALFEIFNGEGALRGIPDEIEVRSIRLWGENRDFRKGMFFAAGGFALLLILFVVATVRSRNAGAACERNASARLRMEKAAKLLKTTDKSVAEIAIAVGCRSASQLERDFYKVYRRKPLDYRRGNV